MPKPIPHQQGDQSWLEWRRGKITASMAGPILGLCNYTTPLQLYNQILECKEIEDNHFIRHGREAEPEAREWLNNCTGNAYTPACYESSEIPWMAASLDGWDENSEIKGAEIKCPKKRFEQFALLDEIPPAHYAQMQHQLHVMEVEKWYYLVYSKEDQDGIIITVKRDDAFIEKMIEAEKAFYRRVLAFDPPDPIDGRDIEILDDPETREAEEGYMMACNEVQQAEMKKERYRQQLLGKANGKSVRTNLLKITKVISKGRIDYGAIEELKAIDLEKYRKPNSTSWRISC